MPPARPDGDGRSVSEIASRLGRHRDTIQRKLAGNRCADGHGMSAPHRTPTHGHAGAAGPALAALPGVHALTDVTGFGLAGHALELARGAGCTVVLDWPAVPLLPGVRDLAAGGFVTGASARNWTGYGRDVSLPADFAAEDKALLTDPQTSGGLLVSCERAALDAVLGTFRRHGFDAAAVIGEVVSARGAALQVGG